jgi:hypothetical protein
LKKKISQVKASGAFHVDWQSSGHTPVVVHDGDGALSDFTKNTGVDAPFAVKNSQMLKDCLVAKEENGISLSEWVSKWEKACTGTPTWRVSDSSTAPLEDKHKGNRLDSFLQKLLPPSVLVPNSSHPCLTALCDKFRFFANSANYLDAELKRECLGSVKIYAGGAQAILLMRGRNAKRLVETLGQESKECSVENVRNIISKLDGDAAKKLATDFQLYHLVVDCKDGPVVLVVPPGFFALQCSINDMKVHGIEQLFLSKHCLEDYTACPHLPGSTMASIVDMLTLQSQTVAAVA